MLTYLSLDFDYWINHSDPDLMEAELEALLDKTEVPVVAVMNHQQMLPHVNASGARRLVNVDAHSDIVDAANASRLHCGNWINYVSWRGEGSYIWIRPEETTENGRCQDLSWYHGHDWGQVCSRYIEPDRINLLRYGPLAGIGLCMSPSYSDGVCQDIFRSIVKARSIPYTKGVLREHTQKGTVRKPPKVLTRRAVPA